VIADWTVELLGVPVSGVDGMEEERGTVSDDGTDGVDAERLRLEDTGGTMGNV